MAPPKRWASLIKDSDLLASASIQKYATRAPRECPIKMYSRSVRAIKSASSAPVSAALTQAMDQGLDTSPRAVMLQPSGAAFLAAVRSPRFPAILAECQAVCLVAPKEPANSAISLSRLDSQATWTMGLSRYCRMTDFSHSALAASLPSLRKPLIQTTVGPSPSVSCSISKPSTSPK